MKKGFVFFCFFFYSIVSFTDSFYRASMRELIQEIRRNTTQDKILITQNGNELYFRDGRLDDRMFSLTQGSTQEDLYYGEKFILSRKTSQKEQKRSLGYLLPLRRAGKVIFSINYGRGDNVRNRLKQELKKSTFLGELLPSFEAKELYEPLEKFHKEDVTSLEKAKNFLCLLNPESYKSLEEYYSALQESSYDVLLIEVSWNGIFFSKEQIESLKRKAIGGKRLVIAYFSIGEAEDYRSYWKKEWSREKPHWILEENPDWKGNYLVKYWSREWKKILKEYQKKLDEIGVDGYLLDTVDSFYYFEEKERSHSIHKVIMDYQ